MHSFIRPYQHVALKLPSDATKIMKVVPNTTVSLGKYGSFPANQIIGRPFYLTFEIQDTASEKDGTALRIVPATELHAEALISEGSGEADGEGEGDEELEMLNEDGTPVRTNREIVDEGSTQKLTLAEIEALKKESSGAGREVISRLLESHSALDQKTAFSLAKYTLRKRKKYMKRFTVVPMDVGLLTSFMLEERDAPRILEMRNELMGMIGCLANVHHGGNASVDGDMGSKPNGRYLVVDETGGLVVAAMAERMGILYPHNDDDEEEEDDDDETQQEQQNIPNGPSSQATNEAASTTGEQRPTDGAPSKTSRTHPNAMSATGNTITLIHAHTQPNLSLLKFFGFATDHPDESHPLYSNLKTASWLQLLDPTADPIYANEPEVIPDATLATYKASKRSMYYRKRNRWTRVRSVVDETRAGGFDGLVVATLMDPASVLRHTVPLLSGSAPVVVYSPTVEPLAELADLYSTPRRSAYIARKRELECQNQVSSSSSSRSPSSEQEQQQQQQQQQQKQQQQEPLEKNINDNKNAPKPNLSELENEYPVDPTLLLPPTIHTTRVRPWQVLPGRTHPAMSGRGGAEGYIFHGIRVLPSQEHIQAAGRPGRKRRKVENKE